MLSKNEHEPFLLCRWWWPGGDGSDLFRPCGAHLSLAGSGRAWGLEQSALCWPPTACGQMAACWTGGLLTHRLEVFTLLRSKVCDPGVPPDAAVSNLYAIVKGWLYDGSSGLDVGNSKQAADRDSSVLLLFGWHQWEAVGVASQFFLPCPLTSWSDVEYKNDM